MEELLAPLEQAFADYKRDIDLCLKKIKPMEGLFGIGRGLKDDPCHERFDERVKDAVLGLAEAGPSPELAELAANMLLLRDDMDAWANSAQWMLVAAQRHVLPLIPLLGADRAAALAAAYEKRWPRRLRFPAQNDLLAALKKAAKA